jgi:hypothetical protein
MLRVITGISIWYLIIPGYAIALILTFVTPSLFTSIAFDSGGVASGPMTATFLLPFAMGATKAIGGNVQTDAFGIVAMVAMTPLITIQCLGLIYRIKSRNIVKEEAIPIDQDYIIEYPEASYEFLQSDPLVEYTLNNETEITNMNLLEDDYGNSTHEL